MEIGHRYPRRGSEGGKESSNSETQRTLNRAETLFGSEEGKTKGGRANGRDVIAGPGVEGEWKADAERIS